MSEPRPLKGSSRRRRSHSALGVYGGLGPVSALIYCAELLFPNAQKKSKRTARFASNKLGEDMLRSSVGPTT